MRNTQPRGSSADAVVGAHTDAAAEVRAWAARRLRFEHLLDALEREAGLIGEVGRPPRS